MRPIGFLALPCLLFLACGNGLFGQATGTIHGTVYDATGAAVPGAAIAATNAKTGELRTVKADSEGKYVIPLLPTGDYSVKIEREGFSPFLRTNVVLQVNTDVQADGHLEIQGTGQQVTVSAEAALVQSTATNLVQVVDQRRIIDLPLNGRNMVELVALSAGVANRASAGGTIQRNTIGVGAYALPVSINGSRGNGTNFLLDDVDNNDGYSNISEPYPNPDAVQEFSVQSSTFDAQYGRGVGGVVNVVTRSGSNEFHGSAFDFLRNGNLNAANFFSGRDLLKRNQFGFSVGGPVLIPRLYNGKNRTFFFGSYQGTPARTATPGSLVISPSDAMKKGDFSAFLLANGTGAIKDPLSSGAFFPNNQIPLSRFDPVAAKMLTVMPSSSDPNYRLRVGTPTTQTDDNQVVLRGDHLISDKQRIAVTYFLLNFDKPWAFIPTNLYYVVLGQTGNAQHATISHTYLFSSKAINQFNVSFHRSTPTAAPPAGLAFSFKDFGGNIKVVPGYQTMDFSIVNWTGTSLGLGYFNGQTTYAINNTFSYATGKNNLKFGGELKRYNLNKHSYSLTGGSAAFGGQLLSDPGKGNSGTAFAEFVLGQVGTWMQQSISAWTQYNLYPALFIQDDLRATSKLTFNFGLRWDPKFDYVEPNKKRIAFVPGAQSIVYPNAPPGVLFQGDPGLEHTIFPADLNNFAPRVGLAYQVRPKTVIRAAYGIFYDQFMGINSVAQFEPFLSLTTLIAPGSLANVYGSTPPLDPTVVNYDKNFVFHPYGTFHVPARKVVAGYMQNWNAVLEQQLSGDVLLRAAYVGSKGTHLLFDAHVNPGIYGPGATAANLNQRRIYQGDGEIELGMSNSWSKYQSVQFTAQKRLSKGYTILANYTISKSIDNSSYCTLDNACAGPNPFNYNDNRGLSDFDTPQHLVVSGIVEHPTLAKQNRLVRTILGGWQSNLIVTAQSGTPFTVLSGIDNALMGVGGNFADLTGVSWHLSGDRSKAAQINQWFNPAAFKVNAVGTIGTGRRNQLRGPGLSNVDYGLFKNFTVGERMKFQFRGEFFNILNHANLGQPNSTVTSSTFGQILTAAAPRIIQVSLKVIF